MMDIYEDVRIKHQHRRLLRHADLLPPRENAVETYLEVQPHELGLLSAQTKHVLPVAPVSLVPLKEAGHQALEDVALGV